MPELVQERSNVFLVEVSEGRIEPRPKTYLNRLQFNYDIDVSVGETFTILKDPLLEITILETGYDVQIGGSEDESETVFVQQSSQKAKSLEIGLFEAIVEDDATKLTEETFPQIRRQILEESVELLFSNAIIQIKEDGVIIDDIYKVSWDGCLLLNQVQNVSYRPGVNSMEEIREEPEFLEVSFNLEEEIDGIKARDIVNNVLTEHLSISLTKQEIETLTLIQFVIMRKDITDDPLFWTQTEKAVLVEQSHFAEE